MTDEFPSGDAGREALKSRIRQLEQDLEACRIMCAEEATMVAKIGHELNNLWTAIAGSLELIERRSTDDKVHRRTGNAALAVARGVGLTERLLAMSDKNRLPREESR